MTRVVRGFLEAILLAVLVFFVIQTTVQNFKVEGSSMQPTLEQDEYLLVNKLIYLTINTERLSRVIPFWNSTQPSKRFAFHAPKRGEVIVFRFPRDPRRDFVKRVIGRPGEKLEMRDGTVYINGRPLHEPYIKDTGDRSNVNETQLKRNEYFVIGDNRLRSNDSRSWGPVPEENIIGKVWFVYWPFSNLNSIQSLSMSLNRLLP